MLSKQIAYLLFGVIISLSVSFGFFVYSSYTKNQNSEEKINKIISQFEEKFKNDSIYLTNANKMLIDRVSQHIIDSMSIVYEEKLENAILKAEKYKQLLIANNINLEAPTLIHSNNTISNNVTTYSKLHRPTEIKKTNSNQLNITTVDKLKNYNNNLYTNTTTNNKIKTSPINTSSKNKSFNITTYSKLKRIPSNSLASKKQIKNSKSSNVTYTDKKSKINKNLTHNNYKLDHAQNINDLDKVPVYKGCGNLESEDKRKNCFAINISKHIINKFNSLKIQNSGLKKGIHKVRVLFIIDEQGNTKIGKLVGKWPLQIYKNVKFAVETTPSMKPGYSNNKEISVKYSLLIPFIIE